MDGRRPMIAYLAGGLLIAIGFAQLILAPLATSCLYSPDGAVCETIGTIVLNVFGVTCLLAGLAVLAAHALMSRRHNISV